MLPCLANEIECASLPEARYTMQPALQRVSLSYGLSTCGLLPATDCLDEPGIPKATAAPCRKVALLSQMHVVIDLNGQCH